MTTPEIRPAGDEEIEARKGYDFSCECGADTIEKDAPDNEHARGCAFVFVPRLEARIEADRARIAELEADRDVYLTLNAEANRTIARQAEEIERLKSQLANCQASSEEIRATAKERTR